MRNNKQRKKFPGKKNILLHTYKVSNEIAQKEFEGNLLFLLPEDQSLYKLNETGKFIWFQIIKKRPLAKIIEEFSTKFDIPYEQAKGDILSFINQLEKKKLIHRE